MALNSINSCITAKEEKGEILQHLTTLNGLLTALGETVDHLNYKTQNVQHGTLDTVREAISEDPSPPYPTSDVPLASMIQRCCDKCATEIRRFKVITDRIDI